MRKVIASIFYTLDGLMSDPKEEMEWNLSIFNDEMGQAVTETSNATDTMLLGRKTYEGFAGYWTTPEAHESDPELAKQMNDKTKIVFSRTLEKADWQNTQLVKGDIGEAVRALKQQPGKDMAIVGSASIVSALTNLGLVDEYQLLLHPVILGAGKPLFQNIVQPAKLKLLRADTFKNGVIALYYEPKRD